MASNFNKIRYIRPDERVFDLLSIKQIRNFLLNKKQLIIFYLYRIFTIYLIPILFFYDYHGALYCFLLIILIVPNRFYLEIKVK